jgi:hypothetical protein
VIWSGGSGGEEAVTVTTGITVVTDLKVTLWFSSLFYFPLFSERSKRGPGFFADLV